jgi:hypothetical protein
MSLTTRGDPIDMTSEHSAQEAMGFQFVKFNIALQRTASKFIVTMELSVLITLAILIGKCYNVHIYA